MGENEEAEEAKLNNVTTEVIDLRSIESPGTLTGGEG